MAQVLFANSRPVSAADVACAGIRINYKRPGCSRRGVRRSNRERARNPYPDARIANLDQPPRQQVPYRIVPL